MYYLPVLMGTKPLLVTVTYKINMREYAPFSMAPGKPAVDPRGSSGFPRTDGRPPASDPGGITAQLQWFSSKY